MRIMEPEEVYAYQEQMYAHKTADEWALGTDGGKEAQSICSALTRGTPWTGAVGRSVL